MEPTAFSNCPPLDGYHCVTNSLAKMFYFNIHPISEDMLLGLGAGLGFIYWKMKLGSDDYVFIGGRGNNKGFFEDVGRRTGVKIKEISTGSEKKAEEALIEALKKKGPVMLFGDMGLLPWFDFPVEYHFGGHTFVACGYDGFQTVLCSDMNQSASGLKKGFYYATSLEQLRRARGSKFKPFPPRNTRLEFDFTGFHQPDKDDLYSSIRQTIDSQLNPPIKNLGVKGMEHTARELLKWPDYFDEHTLRMNLFSLYIFIEIGGTGGGCFRYMYSRFLNETYELTENKKILKPSEQIRESGELFSEVGQLFKDSAFSDDLYYRIKKASNLFSSIAEIEQSAWIALSNAI